MNLTEEVVQNYLHFKDLFDGLMPAKTIFFRECYQRKEIEAQKDKINKQKEEIKRQNEKQKNLELE